MRIPVILTCLLAVLLALVPVRNARADDVSFDVFYNNLADDGDWYNTPEYGYVWQPTVAVKSDKWRPYSDGYWAQTEDGWTWVSYENFGWAVYHYGRWTRLKDLGWAWVPGYDWGPGWVSWRTSDDYVGWAPLPPKVEENYVEGQTVSSRGATASIDYNDVEPEDYSPNVDVQYDIGPDNYCFVDTHNFGAPVLAEVLLPPQRNFIVIEQTTNVTNIYRQRGGDRFVVYNNGPDYRFLSAHSERPIQQLRIEQHNDVGFLRNGIHGGGNANQVRNGVFSVAAPTVTRGPINFAQVKPARVKQTLPAAQVVHGWSNTGADPAAVQRLHAQFKQQAQQAPPPRRDAAAVPPRGNVPPAATNGAQPFNQPNGSNRPPLTGPEKVDRRDARPGAPGAPNAAQPAVETNHPARPNATATTPAPNQPQENGQALTPEERKARRAQRQQEKAGAAPGGQPFMNGNAQPGGAPGANAAREASRPETTQEPARPAPAQTAPPNQPTADQEARRAQRQQEKAERQQAQPQAATPNPEREEQRVQRPPAAPERRASSPGRRTSRRAEPGA